jgi:hypothetical protein
LKPKQDVAGFLGFIEEGARNSSAYSIDVPPQKIVFKR